MTRQERLDEIQHQLHMTEPRRERLPLINVFSTPYDAFPFVGDGPLYEFEIYRWNGIGAAAALNYFTQIGATVVQHERRSYVVSGGTCDDGQTDYYDYYLVKWQPREASSAALASPGREALEHIEAFVARVNARAEADMLNGRPVTGAHHRAIEHELAALRLARSGEP